MRIFRTRYFEKWYLRLDTTKKLKIDARLIRILEFGHFGDTKKLDGNISEMKWSDGTRVYYAVLSNVILLLGGFKNGQSKDIKKAQEIFEEVKHEKE